MLLPRCGSACPGAGLDEAQLNTIGYVVSRYGGLTGQDLERLTHAEPPWQRANERRLPKTSVRIDRSWLEEYFRSEALSDDDDVELDRDEVAAMVRGAEDRKRDVLSPDSHEAIMARLG